MSDDTTLAGQDPTEDSNYTSSIPQNPFAAPYRDSSTPVHSTADSDADKNATERNAENTYSDSLQSVTGATSTPNGAVSTPNHEPGASQVQAYSSQPDVSQMNNTASNNVQGRTSQPSAPQMGVPQGYASQPPSRSGMPQRQQAFSGPTAPYGAPRPSSTQRPSYPYPQQGATSPYAPPPQGGVTSTRRHRRRPGWLAMITTSVVVAMIASGATVGGLWSLDLIGNHPQLVTAQSSDDKVEVAPVVDSQAATADWKAVNEAVGKSVVLIQAIGASGDGGSGSGVIMDKDAHVLTNYHVIAPVYQTEGKGELTVTLADSRVYHAKVVGVDVTTDLAVIKIEDAPNDLTVARLGSSDNLFVGQQVAAIGAPLGLRSTMTTGIISALDRPTVVANRKIFDEVGGAVYTNAIQVDASINPGNSGGPLFDAQGRVIGINSSIISLSSPQQRQAGSIGLGFAIPIDLAKKISQEIITTGTVRHALLGISMAPTYAMVDGTRVTGAEVKAIQPGSKLPESGLQAGDVILSINGNPVVDSSSLIGYVRRYSPGDKVTLQVARMGKRLQLTGELVEAK